MKIEPKKTVLEKRLGENQHSIDIFLKGFKPLSFFIKIYNFLQYYNKDISLNDIEKNIIAIGTGRKRSSFIKNPKLPIRFDTKDAARIIMALYCDGWIGKCLRGGYSNMDIDLRKRVYESFQRVFGQMDTVFGWKEFKLPKICSLIIIKAINFPPGNKTKTNPSFPKFFSNDKELIKSALQQAFDDEGHMQYSLNKRDRHVSICQSIDVTNLNPEERLRIFKENDKKHTPKLLLNIKEMLKLLDIDSRLRCIRQTITKKEEIKHKWLLIISGRENLEKFAEKINFSIQAKQRLLTNAIKNYEREQCRLGQSNNIALNIIQDLNKNKVPITSKTLANELDRTEGHAKELLNSLCYKGLIKIKRKFIYTHKPKHTIYEVVECGEYFDRKNQRTDRKTKG